METILQQLHTGIFEQRRTEELGNPMNFLKKNKKQSHSGPLKVQRARSQQLDCHISVFVKQMQKGTI